MVRGEEEMGELDVQTLSLGELGQRQLFPFIQPEKMGD